VKRFDFVIRKEVSSAPHRTALRRTSPPVCEEDVRRDKVQADIFFADRRLKVELPGHRTALRRSPVLCEADVRNAGVEGVFFYKKSEGRLLLRWDFVLRRDFDFVEVPAEDKVQADAPAFPLFCTALRTQTDGRRQAETQMSKRFSHYEITKEKQKNVL
jgi:hypothetical protein